MTLASVTEMQKANSRIFFWKMEKSFGVDRAVGFQKVVFAHLKVCFVFCKYLDPCLYEC